MYRKTMFKGAKAPNKFKRAAGKTILRAFRRARAARLARGGQRRRPNYINLGAPGRSGPSVGYAYRRAGIRLNRQRPSYKRYTGNSSIGYFNKRY